ncbi:MAG: beta-ketoacyl-ACP synthase [Caulobacterales bacterium]
MRRVVVTGMGGCTALGGTWAEIEAAMRAGKTGTRFIHEWDELTDMSCRVAAPVDYIDHEKFYPRQKIRSMGRVAVLGVHAAEEALKDAGLFGDPMLGNGRVGVACGSSWGSTAPSLDFAVFLTTGRANKLNATSYIRMMSHTSAVNISVSLGLTGRVITTSSACTSGSQGIGYAFENIRENRADVMVAGGAEELCPTMSAVFDRLYASSSNANENPQKGCRPFDKDRDGLVIGEGAAMLILEEREHALARGAKIYAEIVGFATNADGAHISAPAQATQERVMREALDVARLGPRDVSFISGHGTATVAGDAVESHATDAVFGGRIPFHTLKGHYGHSLGACGGIEAWLGIEMMRTGWLAPIANFVERDPKCADLDYVHGDGRSIDAQFFVSNNFAFGGINTSLIIARV